MIDENDTTASSAATEGVGEEHEHPHDEEHEREQAPAGAEGKDGEEEPEPILQQVEMNDVGPCKKHIKVTVDRSTIDKRLNQQYSKLRLEANVAGFRPGKTPRKVIERRFHKEVADQVKGELLLQSLEQLADELEIAPLSPPNLNPFKIEIPKEGPLVYEFEVEVRPDFELPSYKGLKLRRPIKTFTDEEVDAETRHILAEHGQIVPKEEGSTLAVGDIVVADVTSRDGDRVLSELKEFAARVEKSLAFKDGVAKHFAEQVRGAKAGDKRTVDITLSSRSADANLRGKTIKANFDIKDVKTVRLPELSPEFLSAHYGVRTKEQLHEAVRVALNRRLEYLQMQSFRGQIVEVLGKDTKWELPHELLERQAKKAFARRVMEMRSQGISEGEIEGRRRVLEQDVIRSTAQSLMEHFILQKIAEVENIDVTDEDLEQEVERIAASTNESVRRVRARVEKEDLLDVLAAEVLERRALGLILESAEYDDQALEGEEQSTVATVDAQAVPGEMEELKSAEEEVQAAIAEENKEK